MYKYMVKDFKFRICFRFNKFGTIVILRRLTFRKIGLKRLKKFVDYSRVRIPFLSIKISELN